MSYEDILVIIREKFNFLIEIKPMTCTKETQILLYRQKIIKFKMYKTDLK